MHFGCGPHLFVSSRLKDQIMWGLEVQTEIHNQIVRPSPIMFAGCRYLSLLIWKDLAHQQIFPYLALLTGENVQVSTLDGPETNQLRGQAGLEKQYVAVYGSLAQGKH